MDAHQQPADHPHEGNVLARKRPGEVAGEPIDRLAHLVRLAMEAHDRATLDVARGALYADAIPMHLRDRMAQAAQAWECDSKLCDEAVRELDDTRELLAIAHDRQTELEAALASAHVDLEDQRQNSAAAGTRAALESDRQRRGIVVLAELLLEEMRRCR